MTTLKHLFAKVLLIGCFAIIIMGVFLLWQEKGRSQKQWRYDTIARSIETTSSYYSNLLSKLILNKLDLQTFVLDNIKKSEKLVSASIISPKELSSQILATCQVDYKGSYFYQVPTCFAENKYSLTIYHELRSAGQSLGYLAKEYSYGKIGMFDRRQFVVELLLILFAFISVSGCSLFYLYRYVMKPMLGITQTLKHEKKITIPEKSFNLLEINIFVETLRQALDEIASYQERLKQNAALAAIGSSTAMVAHDVRKPLASMKALLSSLTVIKDNPAELKKMIASVDRNIAHTNNMLNEVMDFSRDASALELKEHNVISIITSALGDALRNHPGADVAVEYDLKHSYTSINADGTRITRVLTNLIDNALDAMTPKDKDKASGVLKFGTYLTDKEGKKFLGITVLDNGPGIPEATLFKIFDPFFTQGKKSGTGLGLAICQRVINMHGGCISARNRVDSHGAEFQIEILAGQDRMSMDLDDLIYNSKELQIFREEEEMRVDYGDTASAAEFIGINKERGRPSYLLIVDDEPLFRETIRSLLNSISQVRDHVKIIEADSGEMALKIFEGREFDYVIADIDLGHNRMNGYEFSQIVLEKYLNTYVIIHSNKRKDELDKNIRQIASDKFMGFLPKPMKSSELLQFLACKTFEAPAGKLEEIKSAPKKNVLIVNDDHDLCVALRFMLKSPTVQVLTAANVSSALTYLAERKVDVILSDINLGEGDIDGYELLRKVREKDKEIPFYMVSGFTQSDEEPKAKKLGANGYLQLPVSKEQLQELVQ